MNRAVGEIPVAADANRVIGVPPGFTVRTEWRVVGVTGYVMYPFNDLGQAADEDAARTWAAHCNGKGHTDHEPNTYLINERPFHVERRDIIEHVGAWDTPRPITKYNQVEFVTGSALAVDRLEHNAEAVDDIYPGYRYALQGTLRVLNGRGPWCDTCFQSTIWSEGLGWCHLLDGRNVLPHQDDAGHRATSVAWSRL